ncbi:MAG: pilus assembly protein [Lachnospiraceae bacterium]|nr:pilus assembly protein [Lachnospiraceae bacterium]
MNAAREKGSFTVEAALIMPVILGIIVLFINAAMVFYDRCIMEYACQTACARTVYGAASGAEAEEYIREELSENLVKNWDIHVEATDNEEFVMAGIKASEPLFRDEYVHKAKAYKHFCPKY